MYVVIMAGGKGTRLRTIVPDIPKPMVLVDGKPILEYQIESLKRSGFDHITIIIGYLGNVIKDYFGDGSSHGIKINYIEEEKPLGTAGALYYLKNKIEDDFLLVFGDLMLDIDWVRFMNFHKDKHAWITLFGHPNSHPYDSDIVLVNENLQVTGIDSKNEDRIGKFYHNLVNAGIYCINKKSLDLLNINEKADLEKDVIATLIPKHCVYVYRSSEYVKDMGTPERYIAVVEDVKNGIVSSRSLRKKQKCIFLDRDGTINQLNGFVKKCEEFILIDGIGKAIKKINRSDYLAIVATNQPVIARGECSFSELEMIHMKLETQLGAEGAYLDDIFYCPHHPHKGYVGEVKELKLECECRKPKIGMIVQAAEKYNIDLAESWYIGDTTIDVQTGINAGMRTVLLETGEAGKDGRYCNIPDYKSKTMEEAILNILNDGNSNRERIVK